MVMKRVMLETQANLRAIVGQLARAEIAPAEARQATRTAFATYLGRLEAVQPQ